MWLPVQAYGWAAELQPARLLPRVQAGLIQTALGDTDSAEASFGAALQLDGGHPAALLGLGAGLLAAARSAAAQGAPGGVRAAALILPLRQNVVRQAAVVWSYGLRTHLPFSRLLGATMGVIVESHQGGNNKSTPNAGMAASALARAADAAARCAASHGNLAAAWKLAGDAQLQHHGVAPAASRGASPENRWLLAQFRCWNSLGYPNCSNEVAACRRHCLAGVGFVGRHALGVRLRH